MESSHVRNCTLEIEHLLGSWQIRPEDRHNIVLAIDEALTNILEHESEVSKNATIQIVDAADEIRIEITSQGRPFSLAPLKIKDKQAYLHSDRVGGFGLSIIFGLMDEVKQSTAAEKSCLVMKKKIFGPAEEKFEIETATARAILYDGILRVKTRASSSIKQSDAREHWQKYLDFIEKHPHNRAFGLLLDVRRLRMISAEAKKFYIRQGHSEIRAIAIVVDSQFSRWLGNYFLARNRHAGKKIRLFNHEKEALQWLETFRHASAGRAVKI